MMLRPFEAFYHLLSSTKNAFYQFGIFKTMDVGVPVISVGNLSFGGTGKTPFIEFLVQEFCVDKKVVVVCRSYKAESKQPRKVDVNQSNAVQLFGDEAVLLKKRLASVSVWSGVKKYQTAFASLVEKPELILIDDGFSHRKLKRNFDLVLIDATKLGQDYHRENFRSLKRADAIILTKVNLVTQLQQIDWWIERLSRVIPETQVKLYYSNSLTQLSLPKKSSLFVFCGIGHPESFKKSLQKQSYEIIFFKGFADHQNYDERQQAEILKLYKSELKKHPQLKLVTTAKDAVKITNPELKGFMNIAETKIQMDALDKERLFEKIRSAL
jgi:tetraacyldisaccharide 4'-kinase